MKQIVRFQTRRGQVSIEFSAPTIEAAVIKARKYAIENNIKVLN